MKSKSPYVLSIIIAILSAITSIGGLLLPEMYRIFKLSAPSQI